ncbi:MAG: AAA family ATPase [Patescibacteria group bacterium]
MSKVPQINLSSDQAKVFEAILRWLVFPTSSQLTIGGYAGTGKTTLISLLRNNIYKSNKKTSVGFACYTGKAAENLRSKLLAAKAVYKNDSCGTIHRLMYTPKTNSRGEIISWEKNKKIDKDLIIIDEASMLTENIWGDLLSYRIPIIAFGDHGQLPPIADNFNLMESPNLTLEKIHRQSSENPILHLATKSRLGEKILIKNYSGKVKKMRSNSEDSDSFCQDFFANFDDDSLVLVGMNNTRIKLNQAIRTAKNIESAEPIKGDKVVCLKNIYDNKSGDIYNGMTGIITNILPHKSHWYFAEIFFPQEEKFYDGKISRHQFNSPQPLRSVKGVKPKSIGDLFDFGYALTVHKAQGSEAKKVLLFDESFVFNKRDPNQGKKWLYTAITRAQEELCILGY